MTWAEIDRLFAYHRWANGRTLEAAAALTHEQLTCDIKSSFPSVLATLVHVLSSDWVWLQRWKGNAPTGWPEAEAMTSVALLRERWRTNELEQSAFIAAQTDASLEHVIAYRNIKGEPFDNPLGDLCQHVVNHATYHRGQVTTMIRQLGGTVEPTDFVAFLRR